MSSASGRNCWGNQNTRFMFNNFFFFRKSCPLWDNVERYCRAGQASYDNIIRRMRIGCCIPKATNTLSGHLIRSFRCNNGCRNAPQCYVISCLVIIGDCSPRGTNKALKHNLGKFSYLNGLLGIKKWVTGGRWRFNIMLVTEKRFRFSANQLKEMSDSL